MKFLMKNKGMRGSPSVYLGQILIKISDPKEPANLVANILLVLSLI